MGQLFVKLLKNDHEITVADATDWECMPELVKSCDLVLIAVTMAHTSEVVSNVAPLLSAEQGICDITSIKGPVVDQMLDEHSGPVLGMHPIFGPGIQLNNHPFVFCEGRDKDFFEPLVASFYNKGFDCAWMSAERHDSLMDVIQGLNYHCLRLFIDCANEDDLAQCPIQDVIEHFQKEDQGLYDSIINATDGRRALLKNFDETIAEEEKSKTESLFSAMIRSEINFALKRVNWETLWRFASPNYRAKLRVYEQLI